MAGPNPQPPMVNITQRALAELKRLKNSQLNQEKPYLRVELVKGGCLDYIYNLRFDSHIKDSDVTLTHPSGITIVTDYDSYPHVEGLTIDYLEDLMGARFNLRVLLWHDNVPVDCHSVWKTGLEPRKNPKGREKELLTSLPEIGYDRGLSLVALY
ncbi:MAG: iron-sulfur cluster assembly accessory protein [Geminocystis sp.]|nr:iron-sulfur cluster assembly accessory protein [Geminocystis sp.]